MALSVQLTDRIAVSELAFQLEGVPGVYEAFVRNASYDHHSESWNFGSITFYDIDGNEKTVGNDVESNVAKLIDEALQSDEKSMDYAMETVPCFDFDEMSDYEFYKQKI